MIPHSGHAVARRDIAADITAKIIADLERGVLPWKKPWNGDRAGGSPGLPLRFNGAPYRGVNVVLLWSRAADAGFRARHWFSFRQALALGAHVRKGEKGESVVYYGRMQRTRTDRHGDTVEDSVRFLRAYTVFNADQIEGLPQGHAVDEVTTGSVPPISEHEAWFASLDIQRVTTRDQAFYSPGRDVIGMPPIDVFDGVDLYAQTLNHECVHATGAPHRVGRDFSRRYGDHAYHVEEICAELGAAYLGAYLGLPPGHLHDHSAYIGDWIALMKRDRRAFFDAAAKAQAAVDWLLIKSGRVAPEIVDTGGEAQ
jgi:antirestriction protein ArdC